MEPTQAVHIVPESLEGERVDVGLARLVGWSRTKAGNMISDGCVTLNGKTPTRSDRLAEGQRLVVKEPTTDARDEEDSADVVIEVIHQDADVVVVNKPVGVAAHASPGWTGPTLTSLLPRMGITLAAAGPAERQGVVHRLDVGTTGVMVLARSDAAYVSLKAQFKEREVNKTYHALVQGHPDPSTGTVNAPIGRHPVSDHRFAVVTDGKPSVTHYRTLNAFPHASLLEVDLETGRTHQIRVHMSAMKHPVCGDLTYGADPTLAKRIGLAHQGLHAYQLAFTHPGDGKRMEFHANYPADLAHAIRVLDD